MLKSLADCRVFWRKKVGSWAEKGRNQAFFAYILHIII
jgi:hypothetical protein